MGAPISRHDNVVQPEWINITTFQHRGYEVELDSRARETSPKQYRHRKMSFTGDVQTEWKYGMPPDD